jgi:hypothetical protein
MADNVTSGQLMPANVQFMSNNGKAFSSFKVMATFSSMQIGMAAGYPVGHRIHQEAARTVA